MYLSHYIDHDLYDEDLFWELKQDFAGWKRQHFDQAGILKRDFKRVLMERGIFVPLKGYSDAIGLEMAISGNEPHIWTKEEIAVALKRKLNYHPKISILENEKSPVTTLKTKASSIQYRTQEAAKSEYRTPSYFPRNFENGQQKLIPPYQSIGPQTPILNPQELIAENRTNSFWVLPPVPVKTETIDPDMIVKFVKCFDHNKRYTGEPIRAGQLNTVFPRILIGRAEWYFTNHIRPNDMFSTIYNQLKQHFDTEVNQEHYYTDWTTVTFEKLRREYQSENLHQILQRLFDKLLLYQRALGPMYAGQKPLKAALIRACRGVPELEYALFRPANDVEKLLSEL
ncbi:hypothetical protein GcM3_200068, partial [Golovinomyces cichoracearum]